jgi:hypothetical protein
MERERESPARRGPPGHGPDLHRARRRRPRRRQGDGRRVDGPARPGPARPDGRCAGGLPGLSLSRVLVRVPLHVLRVVEVGAVEVEELLLVLPALVLCMPWLVLDLSSPAPMPVSFVPSLIRGCRIMGLGRWGCLSVLW